MNNPEKYNYRIAKYYRQSTGELIIYLIITLFGAVALLFNTPGEVAISEKLEFWNKVIAEEKNQKEDSGVCRAAAIYNHDTDWNCSDTSGFGRNDINMFILLEGQLSLRNNHNSVYNVPCCASAKGKPSTPYCSISCRSRFRAVHLQASC